MSLNDFLPYHFYHHYQVAVMKKIIVRVSLIIGVILIAIQFVPTPKNDSTDAAQYANDISTRYALPDSVQIILQTSCYDCHSNHTQYPWYAHVQPIAWWLNDHIEEGKKEINFSEFAAYRIGRQYKKMEEVIEEMTEDEMPLGSYTLIHQNAKLNEVQRQTLIHWATQIRDSIKANYPADSLVRKKSPEPAKS